MSDAAERVGAEGIAVVGMAGRFPGAGNVGEFWRNLRDGVESVSFFTDEELEAAGAPAPLVADPAYVKAKAVLENVEEFDARFFGFTPREAEITDPQQRIFLECAWASLEDAGYDPARYAGPIGVFAGAGVNTYLLRNLAPNRELFDAMGAFQTSIHNRNDHLSTRVAYLLNLRGPCVTVQTACSTSLVAVSLACQSLLTCQCDMALAGGVTVTVPQKSGYVFQEGGINSPDGHCRAFDARAAGTVEGNGAGVVVLKRLEDALRDGDQIHAVIIGSAVNNDGARKAGYTAPGVDSQAEVIAQAQAVAGVGADSVTYVEAHGTATPLGDPIEIAALTKAFRLTTGRRQFCAVGSAKANIGHLDAAAGVAGLIKTILALRHEAIPPSLHFERPNPQIDFSTTPFFVNAKLSEWRRGAMPRRAGVSSFGIGGTNAHVVLEEAPEVESGESARGWQLLLLSARTGAALEAASDNLAQFLEADAGGGVNLADVAYTLQVGRAVFNQRRAVLCRDAREAARALRTLDYERVASRFQEPVHRPVTFMFPGQGAQYAGMAAELYRTEPVLRRHVDACAEMLVPHLGEDLRESLYPNEEGRGAAGRRLDQTAFTQPALFVTEYALAQLWMSWGVRPASMIGHSVGEYVAACLAGVFSLEDALALVAYRGRLIQELPGGSMLAVTLPEREVLPLLGVSLSLAAVNGPSLCVAAGPTEAVDELEAKLGGRGVICRRLHTSHAFHSEMIRPACDAFAKRLRRVRLSPPRIPYVSNVTGTWVGEREVTDAEYWTRHLRETVRFGDGVAELLKEPERVLLEVGPGRTLKTSTRWHPAKAPAQVVETSLPHRGEQHSDAAFLMSSLGKLWLAGVEIDWQGFNAHERRRRVALPTYPFERKRHWIEERPATAAPPPAAARLRRKEDLADWFYAPVWKETPAPRLDAARLEGRERCWLVFADEGEGRGERLARRLEASGQKVFTAYAAAEFGRAGERAYRIDPARREDYAALLEEVERRGGSLPDAIVHLWSAGDDNYAPEARSSSGVSQSPAEVRSTEEIQRRGFYSLLLLAQAVGGRKSVAPIRLTVVSSGVQSVTGEEVLCPEKATLLGPCKVIPREYPQLSCRSVDIRPPRRGGLLEERLIEQLIAEAAGGAPEAAGAAPSVAYRGGRRWTQDYEAVRLGGEARATPAGDTPALRECGVYLITGGLGGVGLALAEHLARTVRARLVLCARSPFPPRESWDDSAAHDDATRARIGKLRRLEEAGAEVSVVSADVTSVEQMRAVVAGALERFGQLDGVIHAAGVAGGGLIQLRELEDAARVLAPKVAGARALEAACENLELDFFVLCSSLAAVVGRPGQADYCAANAFLDAFAQAAHARGAAFTVSVNWGEWQQVGMAAGNPLAPGGGAARSGGVKGARKLEHPLLEKCFVGASGEEVYTTEFNVNKHWVLDEHRLVGHAVIPGVAYFEMVRAALGARARGKTVELHDVYFVGPLHVRDDQTREVRLTLQPEAGGWGFTVESEAPGAGAGAAGGAPKYALGKVRLSEAAPPPRRDVGELIARCNVREEVFAEEEREDDLGPRWQSVKRGYVGEGEVVTALELSEDFAADFELMEYHPALMDRAVGRAKEYLVEGEYLPVSYKLLRIHAPVPRKVYSHARYRDGDDALKETLTWDTVVLDEHGVVLAEIEGFVQKRINDAATTIKSYAAADGGGLASRRPEPVGPSSEEPAAARAAAPEAAGEEMRPAEGAEALGRILAHRVMPQVAVSVRDLRAAIEQADAVTDERLQAEAEKPRAASAAHPRPELAAPYAAPRGETENKIAAAWREVLGLSEVGVNDNFFELGGDSVQAILIIASLNKAGLRLTPQQFFQYQTVAELSEMIAAGPAAPSAGSAGPPDNVVDEATTTDVKPPSSRDEGAAAGASFDFASAGVDEDELGKLSQLLAEVDEAGGAEESSPAVAEAGGGRGGPAERIEDALRRYPSVREAVVLTRGAARAGDGGRKELVAFVVLDGENGDGSSRPRPTQFSLFYFADDNTGAGLDKYRLYLDGATFADRHDFAAVWTPERHFHSTGGLYPNPSVLSAALATVTRRVGLRAGSVVLPLHHALRVAEEWSVVDNLSRGRVGVSFTSGWIPNDFALFPERFADRRGEMFEAVEQVRRLWRGEAVRVKDGAGNETEVTIFPRPVQPELPVWLTCSGDPQMFVRAGELGANVLTALLTQSIEETASKIKLYREARARAGHDARAGHVTLMLHTFVGGDERGVLEKARAPLCNYLKSHVGLVETMVKSLNLQADLRREAHLDDLVSFAFERYYRSGSLIGTPDKCLRTVERVRDAGVDEVACFIDFGVDAAAVLDSLPQLDALKKAAERAAAHAPSGDTREATRRLLSEHVRQKLSAEMAPSAFLLLDALPRHADGTVNRDALAARSDVS